MPCECIGFHCHGYAYISSFRRHHVHCEDHERSKGYSGKALSSGYTWTFVTEGGQIPVESLEAGGWIKAAAGWEHAAAIKVDGTLWAWGYNLYGQLGDGTIEDKSVPVKVGSDTTWAALSAGDHFTAAIREDGTLWTWGENKYGQLGDGTRRQTFLCANGFS